MGNWTVKGSVTKISLSYTHSIGESYWPTST